MNSLFAADGYKALGTTQFAGRGEGGSDDTGFQFVEDEYMLADEYDEFLADPNGFTFRKIFPRIATNLEGFAQVPIPPLYFMANTYYLHVGGPLLGMPPRKARACWRCSTPWAATSGRRRHRRAELAALGHPRAVAAPSSRRSTWSRTCSARCAAARSTCSAARSSCSGPSRSWRTPRSAC